MRRRQLAIGIIALLGMGLASCSSNSGSSSTSTTTTPPSSTTIAPATTTTAKASTHCSTEQLKASLGESQSGAGQRYTVLVLTNTGSKSCDLRGFPGVSLLDSTAKQIGEPASREGSEGSTVVIAPGGSASTTLHTSTQGVGPACTPTSAQMRVYPPDNTAPLTFAAAYSACGGFRVSTLVSGAAGN